MKVHLTEPSIKTTYLGMKKRIYVDRWSTGGGCLHTGLTIHSNASCIQATTCTGYSIKQLEARGHLNDGLVLYCAHVRTRMYICVRVCA